MPRLRLLLLALVVGCGTKPNDASMSAPVGASSAGPEADAFPTEPWQNDDKEEVRWQQLLGQIDQLEAGAAGTEKARLEFQSMNADEKQQIEDVRETLKRRPPVELSAAQLRVLEQRESFVSYRSVVEHKVALANQRGANALVKKLELGEQDADVFKKLYGETPSPIWQKVRGAIEAAVANGMKSISDVDRAILRDNGYQKFLSNVRETK